MVDHSGDNIVSDNTGWTFSGETSKKFDAHVSKSVPLYAEGHDLILKLSDFL